jgi:hypothetical protein
LTRIHAPKNRKDEVMTKSENFDRRQMFMTGLTVASLTSAAGPASATATAGVVRVSRGSFDPARFAEVDSMIRSTGDYLIPAVRRLPGLVSYYAGTAPSGSVVNVSLWETEAHAQQMSQLKEMTDRAYQASLAAGVNFIPIVNYPIAWRI